MNPKARILLKSLAINITGRRVKIYVRIRVNWDLEVKIIT